MVKRLDHVAIAVASIEQALRFYRDVLGLPVTHVEEMPERALKITFVGVGDTAIELLEPTDPESNVGKFLARRGEGQHHICLEVDDIDAELERLKDQDVELIDLVARPGARGRIAFIHPRAANGVLIELLERAPVAARDGAAPPDAEAIRPVVREASEAVAGEGATLPLGAADAPAAGADAQDEATVALPIDDEPQPSSVETDHAQTR